MLDPEDANLPGVDASSIIPDVGADEKANPWVKAKPVPLTPEERAAAVKLLRRKRKGR